MTSATQRQHSRKDAKRACREEGPLSAPTEKAKRWDHPIHRAQRHIDSSQSLVDSIRRALLDSTDSAAARPIGTSRKLNRVSCRILDAHAHLASASRDIDAVMKSAVLAPELAADVPMLLIEMTQQWVEVARQIALLSNDLFGFHEEVLDGLKSGELVPEPPAARRPRIIVIPRLISARAFLLHRRKSALDRIASIPARRPPAARISSTDAPRRISRGRAPPSDSICLP